MLSIKEIASSFIVVAAENPPTPEAPTPPTPTAPERPRDKPKFGAGKGSRPQPPPMNKSLRPRRR
ncbi:MAG TPA: hypothetical protein VGM90_28335 [Kofleriaceae bacterium]